MVHSASGSASEPSVGWAPISAGPALQVAAPALAVLVPFLVQGACLRIPYWSPCSFLVYTGSPGAETVPSALTVSCGSVMSPMALVTRAFASTVRAASVICLYLRVLVIGGGKVLGHFCRDTPSTRSPRAAPNRRVLAGADHCIPVAVHRDGAAGQQGRHPGLAVFIRFQLFTRPGLAFRKRQRHRPALPHPFSGRTPLPAGSPPLLALGPGVRRSGHLAGAPAVDRKFQLVQHHVGQFAVCIQQHGSRTVLILPARSLPVGSVKSQARCATPRFALHCCPRGAAAHNRSCCRSVAPPQPVSVSAAASVQPKNQRDTCFISSHTLPFRACIADAGLWS